MIALMAFASKRPPLPPLELIRAAQAGDRQSIDRLVRSSMWIVLARSKRYLREGVEHDDLIQVALAGAAVNSDMFGGVLRAIETFDPTRGSNFWSHVTAWVESALGRYHEVEHHPMLRSRVELSDDIAAGHDPEREADVRKRLRKLLKLPAQKLSALVGWGEGRTFSEIGEQIGVSRESARKITAAARVAQGGKATAGSRNRGPR